jgi:uncharacterized protein
VRRAAAAPARACRNAGCHWSPTWKAALRRPGPALQELQELVQRRHAELDQAIGQRDWFDPWIYQLDDDAEPSECLLPWVAGFAAAMEAFPALMAMSDPELVEPLALLFMHFDPDDLEDADALAAVIERWSHPPTWAKPCRTPCVR